MSSFPLDHRVVTPNRGEKSTGDWSARRRTAALAACIIIAWSVMLAPLFIWL